MRGYQDRTRFRTRCRTFPAEEHDLQEQIPVMTLLDRARPANTAAFLTYPPIQTFAWTM